MSLCREQSFILLYRLLFIMYAEDRGLLPYRKNATYTNNRSLGRHRDEIAARLDKVRHGRDEDYSRESTHIWGDMLDLFDLVDRGHRRYEVPAYNGGLFDADAHPFLTEKALPDWYLARVIDQLGRAVDPNSPDTGSFRVDYRDLAIQHLGAIYEGMLELQPHHATERMVVVSRRRQGRTEERIIPATDPIPDGWQKTDLAYRRGSIYLQTEKGERRAWGSYYTPDHIVAYIVENTLGPLCRRVSNKLDGEIADARRTIESTDNGHLRKALEYRLKKLARDFDDRILRLRILDPAMGSGHFLIRACQYLAEEIATHPYSGDESLPHDSADESSMLHWKRLVVENCLYGVDLNPLAVELAKLALWLETVAHDRPLSFLDHHLRHGNSLIGAKIAELGVLPGESADGNPFKSQVEAKLPVLLGPLAEIRETPSESAAQIKEKAKLYRRFEKARGPFRAIADLWCSTFAADADGRVEFIQYQRAVSFLAEPGRFRRITREAWFRRALELTEGSSDFRPFHWELEFPEAYFTENGRRAGAGFDAVIGNPPYDVLSERETGRDLATIRAVIDHEPAYKPSIRGKNNLYKLFVCRAVDLLTDGAYLGFITPMAVLGDDQAADLRRALLDAGTFTVIDAFPQKDDPRRRVFPEAKLSTAVFVLHKCDTATADAIEFTSRVHPGRDLEDGSPSLRMRRRDIPSYDPSNYTLISCSQADLDLAVRIMQSGRMRRLRDVAQFFQGEVNETVQRRKGTIKNAEGGRFRKLVTRGANICLYVLRDASQGRDIYLDVEKFLEGASEESKAYHHRHARVGLQESCPQNNFRRIIAAHVPAGEFCNHTVNYCPAHKCAVDLRLVLAVLNSNLADWYFRLGSTNAHVSHYQLYNLPFPRFANSTDASVPDAASVRDTSCRSDLSRRVLNALDTPGEGVDAAWQLVAGLTPEPPFDPLLAEVITAAVQRIEEIETARGEIARPARSALAPQAQPYQDFIDRLLYNLAGLSQQEAAGLESRLAAML